MAPRIAIVAGEASGDLLASALIRALKERRPDLCFEGIAGPQMIAAGCECLYPLERLSVMGLTEALGRYLELLPVRARLKKRWLANPPALFIGVDAPDFNLSLEEGLHKGGITTAHYVSPSVWAWRRYRIRKIARAVDRMLTLFPFEADFYREHDVPVSFVGHPLSDIIPADTDRDKARGVLNLPTEGEYIALLPGSRGQELDYLAEPMVGAARWLNERRPDITFIAPMINADMQARFQQVLAQQGQGLDIRIIDGQSRTVMAAADAILLASGTATLEAMLLNRPMVVAYRMHPVSFHIMKALFSVNNIALPNLLAGKQLVPELLQSEATPERLGAALLELLENDDQRQQLSDEFSHIRTTLGNDAGARAAEAILELLPS